MRLIKTPGSQNNRFVGNNTTTNQQGTQLSAAWFNSVQDELVSVLTAAGLTPNDSQNNQLALAISSIITTKLQQAAQSQLTEARVVELIKKYALTWEETQSASN